MVRKRSVRHKTLGRTLIASHWIRQISEHHRFGSNPFLQEITTDETRFGAVQPEETSRTHYYKIRTTFGLKIRIRLWETEKKYSAAILFSTHFLQTPRAWKDKMKRLNIDKHSWYNLLESDKSPWFEPKGGQTDPRLEATRYSKLANMWNLPFPSKKNPKIQSYDCWVKGTRHKNGFGKHDRFECGYALKKDEISSWSAFLEKVPFAEALIATCHDLNMRLPFESTAEELCFNRKGVASPGRNIQGILIWEDQNFVNWQDKSRSYAVSDEFYFPADSSTIKTQ